MDEIIKAISAKLNLPETVVRTGAGVLLNFLRQKAAGSQFEKLVALIPDANAAMAAGSGAAAAQGGGGLLGGLISSAGGLLGGQAGEIAKVLGALNQAGVPADKAAPFAGEFIEQIKQMAGPETVNEILSSIPAAKAFFAKE